MLHPGWVAVVFKTLGYPLTDPVMAIHLCHQNQPPITGQLPTTEIGDHLTPIELSKGVRFCALSTGQNLEIIGRKGFHEITTLTN
jgi:hypothetical protein